MERAWDVNPGATSAVIVAVLDGGLAYDTATYQYNARAVSVGTRRYPALGRVDDSLRRGAGADRPQPLRRAARLHLGRRRPGRSRRPRHARRRHHRPAHEQRHRRRRHGVQRPAHAGQGDRRRLGLHLRRAERGDDVGRGGGHPLRRRQRRQGHQHEHRLRGERSAAGDRGGAALRRRQGRVRDGLRGQRLRGRQPGGAAGRDRRADGRRDLGRRGRPQPQSRPLFELAHVGRDRRARAATSASAASPAASSSRPTTRSRRRSIRCRARWRCTTRRATTSSATRPTRARRWRRRTSPAWPRCSIQQGITKPAAIEAAIKRFATDRGAAGRDDDFGYGLISPRETLRGLGLTR